MKENKNIIITCYIKNTLHHFNYYDINEIFTQDEFTYYITFNKSIDIWLKYFREDICEIFKITNSDYFLDITENNLKKISFNNKISIESLKRLPKLYYLLNS